MIIKKYICLHTFLLVICSLQGSSKDIILTPEQACQVLEESFLIMPHKKACLRTHNNQNPEKVNQESNRLHARAQSLVTSVQQALAHSEEMRIFLKNYFMPGAQGKSFLQIHLDPASHDTGISYTEYFYQEKIRRFAIARLLSFLKSYVYCDNDFPSFYEDFYNRMIVSLAYKTLTFNKQSPSVEIPTVTFNRDVLFKSAQRLWNLYHTIKGDIQSGDITKIIHLYRVYDVICTMEGDLLDKDQKNEYQNIRKEVISSLKKYQDSLTPGRVARFFTKNASNGKSDWCTEALNGIEKLRDPEYYLDEDPTASKSNNGIHGEGDYRECRQTVYLIRGRKDEQAYYHFLSSLYIYAQPNSLEKAYIEEIIKGRIRVPRVKKLKNYCSVADFTAAEEVLLPSQMPMLPSLKTVEEEIQAEIIQQTFNKHYYLAWLRTDDGFFSETREVYKKFGRGQPSVRIDTTILPKIQSHVHEDVHTPPPDSVVSYGRSEGVITDDYDGIKKLVPWTVISVLGIGTLWYFIMKRQRTSTLKQPHYSQKAVAGGGRSS